MTADSRARVRFEPVNPRPSTKAVLRVLIEAVQTHRHKYAWDASIGRQEGKQAFPRFVLALKTYDDLTHGVDLLETLLQNPEAIDRILAELKGEQNQLTLDI